MSPINVDALQAAYRSAPELDAATQVGIGSTATNVGDAVTAAQATNAMGQSTISANTLKTLSHGDQVKLWSGANDQQRQLWQGAGYNGPGQAHRGLMGTIGNIVGDVGHAVGRAWDDTGGQVVHGVAQGAGDVLHGLQVIGSGSQHVFRTAVQGTENMEAQPTVGHRFGVTLSPSAWQQAWTATGNGNKMFRPGTENRITQQYEGRDIDLGTEHIPLSSVAKAMAEGTLDDLYKSLGNPSDPNVQDAIATLNQMVHNDKDLQSATQDFNNNKISFGRMLIPESLWKSHPAVASAVSGSGDAVYDMFADPTLAAGKIRKVYQGVRWAVHSTEDVDRVMATAPGERWLQDVTDRASQGDYAGILNRMPSTSAMLPSLADKEITSPRQLLDAMKFPVEDTSPENVAQWTKDNYIAGRILGGDGTAPGRNNIFMPRLTVAGKAWLDTKDVLNKAVDWSKNVELPAGPNGVTDAMSGAVQASLNVVGSMAKKMTTLIPEGHTFNPNGPEALTFVQRFANTYLDKGAADSIVNAWASAGYDTGVKRNIYNEMLGKVFESAGMNNSERGQQLMRKWLTQNEEYGLRQQYAPGSIDNMIEDGKTVANGITEDQLTSGWSLPSFKALAAASQKDALGKIVYGVTNNHLANSFNAIWKPAQLLRFGFPIRVSLDELTGGVLRNGAWNTVQARVAQPIARAINDYQAELDPEHAALAAQDGTGNAIAAANLAQRAKYAMAKTGKALISDDYYDAAKWGLDNDLLGHGLVPEISARHGARLGDDIDSMVSLLKDGVTQQRTYFQPGSAFRGYELGNDLYTRMWKYRLNQLSTSPLMREVMSNRAMSDEELTQHVADFIQAPEWASNWSRSARSQMTSDGRQVGIDATERQAAENWASKAIAMHDSYLKAPDGTLHQDLVNHMLDTKTGPELQTLEDIPKEQRPAEVTGPETVPVVAGGVGAWLKNFSDRGFDLIGKQIDWMARQPLFLHNFSQAYTNLRPLVEDAIGEGPATEEVLRGLVMRRAINATAPFIHNPEIRSQMNILTGNLVPFQFAQEQFYKRWGRSFVHSPEAIRKAQLGVSALGQDGITHDDGTGNQVFTYPAMGAAQNAIVDGLKILGVNALAPVHGGFSGQLKMVAPGLDRTFAPSFGPLVSAPLSALTRIFPELNPLKGTVEGPIGANRSTWEQLVPASLARIVHAAIDQPSISNQYASAMMNTVRDLFASGKGLSTEDAADPAKRQNFLDAVKNGTRVEMIFRALLGFSAPAAPQAEIGNTEFGKRMKELQKQGLDFSTAQRALLKADPTMAPYAVYMSTAAGDEPLPATKQALDTFEANRAFMEAHPEAGGFFLPAGPSTDPFSSEAYRMQVATGMRQRRSPEEFLNQLLYNEAATDYFDTRDEYNRVTQHMKGAAKAPYTKQWEDWKTQYWQDHPVFADRLQSKAAAIKRGDTFTALQKALDDPRAPQGPQTESLRDMVDTYGNYKAYIESLSSRHDAGAKAGRKRAGEQMVNWAHGAIANDPVARNTYNALIRPDLEGVQ